MGTISQALSLSPQIYISRRGVLTMPQLVAAGTVSTGIKFGGDPNTPYVDTLTHLRTDIFGRSSSFFDFQFSEIDGGSMEIGQCISIRWSFKCLASAGNSECGFSIFSVGELNGVQAVRVNQYESLHDLPMGETVQISGFTQVCVDEFFEANNISIGVSNPSAQDYILSEPDFYITIR